MGYIRQHVNSQCFNFMYWEQKKMGKWKELWRGQVSTYQKWLSFSIQKNLGQVPRSWFRTNPESLLVLNKETYDVSRWRFQQTAVWKVPFLKVVGVQVKKAEEGRLVEAVLCSGQWSAGKSWVLAFMWMLLWHVPPACTYTPSRQCCSLLASFNRIIWNKYSTSTQKEVC